jgi:hypothetical protein
MFINNSSSTVFDFVNKHSYLILLTLFIAWMCIGIFPLQCYEADGLFITRGFDIVFREGWQLPPLYTYEYRQQPLITILVVSLKHLMPFFTCEQIYCVFTALSSFIFLIGCVEFARYITKSGRVRILIAAMLLPEMYAIAMYPNTAIPAAACFIWALMLTANGKHWQSVILLCIGTWFRLDIVSVYPVILPLLYFERKSFWKSFWTAAAYAPVIIAISLFGFWLMNADALSTYGEFVKWNDIITPVLRFYAIFGFYSLAYLVLLPVGLCAISIEKKWKELFVVLLPIILVHSVMGEFGNASKHFLYIAPFAIIAGVRALQWLESLLSRRPVLKWAAVFLTAIFLTVSVRHNRDEVTWLKNHPLHHVGIVVPISSCQVAGKNIDVNIGAGYQVITRDEYMIATGHLFYSWYIHCIKTIMKDWRKEQKVVLDKAPSSDILTLEYGAAVPLSSEYLTEGYHFRKENNMSDKYEFTIYNSNRKLTYWRIYLREDEYSAQQVLSYIDSLSQVFKGEEAYVQASSEHYGTEHVLDEIEEMGRVEKKAPKLFKIIK